MDSTTSVRKNSMDISSIPTNPKAGKRICYIFVGKPGVGKTILAEKLSQSLPSVFISPKRILTDALADANSQECAQISEYLKKGETIPASIILDTIKAKAKSDEAAFKGYILDGIPDNMEGLENDQEQPQDIATLFEILSLPASTHIPVLVNLSISDENLVRRRAAQWVDPKTNISYSGQQVSYSRKRRADGWIDGAEDEVALAEEKLDQEAPETPEEQNENEDDDQIEEIEGAANAETKEKTPETQVSRLNNRSTWPILSEEILNRLLKNPEDDPQVVAQNLATYTKCEKWINDLRTQFFDILHVIDLDGAQHPQTILKNLLTRIDTLGFSIFRTPEVKALNAPDGGFRALGEADIVRYWQTCQLEEGEPRRELSKWGRYCPVTFSETDVLNLGSLNECAAYKGFIYLLSNESSKKKFLANPDKYLSNASNLKNLQVSVLGGPFSGKTKQSKLLASRYKLVYLNAEEILSKLDSQANQDDLKTARPLYAEIVQSLKMGVELSASLIVKLFLEELDIHRAEGLNGWVMDGFPKNLEQINALQSANLLPKHVIFLKNDINDDTVRSRGDVHKSSSISGKALNNPQLSAAAHSGLSPNRVSTWSPELEISMYPNFDNMFNGFKEELSEIVTKFNEVSASITQIQAENGASTIFSTLLNAVDPLIPKAGPKELAEIPGKVELGATKDYCPVVLRDSKTLQKGSKNYAAKYQSGIYYFSTEEARASFLVEPFNFINKIKIPPMRLVFLGPKGAGKTTYIKALGLTHVYFPDYLLEFAARQPTAQKEEILYMINENAGLLSPAVICEVLSSLFKEEPYLSKGFALEGFPKSRLEMETMIKNNFHVDAFINLKTNSEVCCRRLLSERLRKHQTLIDAAVTPEQMVELRNITEEDMVTELVDAAEKEISQVTEVLSTLESLAVIPVIDIDANRYVRPVMATLKEKLAPWTHDRRNIFLSPFKVSKNSANLLLRMGIKSFSPCGKLCPVTVKTNGTITSTCQGKFPVVCGDQIYFLRDRKARKEFITRPLTYIFEVPTQPIVLPTICVVGPPKSGKTTLSKSVAAEKELVHLSVPDILKSILDGNEISSLNDKLKACLEEGKEVPVEIVSEAIQLVTSRTLSRSRGWIIDGYPNTIEQARELERIGIVPHILVHISMSEEEAFQRTEIDAYQTRDDPVKKLNVKEATHIRYEAYQASEKEITELYHMRYSNVLELTGTDSKWYLKETLKNQITGSMIRRQDYLEAKTGHKAAAIYDIGLSIPLVQANMGKYMDYCPVSYVDHSQLKKGPNSLRFMAEYNNVFYRMIGAQELNSFLANPSRYAEGKDLPSALPIRRSAQEAKEMFPKALQLRGYCPVTLKNGKEGFESLVLGTYDNIVEHDGLLYAMETNEKLLEFMRSPWNYTSLTLPKKLPPVSAPIPISGLPIVGYLEQSVATSLTEALGSLGKFKPKYPFKSLKSSAAQYLALQLKASNPKSKDWIRSKFEKRLRDFKQDCELIKAVAKDMKACGDNYVEPQDRPQNLEQSLKQLEQLKAQR